MVCDFCVIAMTLLIYDHVDRGSLRWIDIRLCHDGNRFFTVDYVLTGKTQSAQLFIFTDKYDEVARELTNQVHRGVTLIDAKGWYTGQDKKIILIVARKHEASDVLRIAKQIDRMFMTMAPVMGVFGKGFERGEGGEVNESEDSKGIVQIVGLHDFLCLMERRLVFWSKYDIYNLFD